MEQHLRDEIYALAQKIAPAKIFDGNIKGFMKPIEIKKSSEYGEKLKEKLKEYMEQINAFRNQDDSVKENIRKICELVVKSYECMKNGNNACAEKNIKEIIKSYKKNSFAVSDLNESYAFRGCAQLEEMEQDELNFFRARVISKGEITERRDINYLSYSDKNKAVSMRFSNKEVICLYLGTTSYVCARECRWNGRQSDLYLASFKFKESGKKLKILNLVVTQAVIDGLSSPYEKEAVKELYIELLKVFPLVIATMFTVKNNDKNVESERDEYLISQLLMKVLNEAGIDGVAYLSRQGRDDYDYPQTVCLAIPIHDSDSKKKYGSLVSKYVMTQPYKFVEIEEKYEQHSYINRMFCGYDKSDCNSKIYYNGKETLYRDTPFSVMDDFLINQEHSGLNGEE